MHTCQVCEKNVGQKDLSIHCDICYFTYHKKCTALKSASGYWKPNQWKCLYCKDLNSRTQEENEVTMVQSEKSKKPPPLSKKHRKTNLNVINPDSELYQSQIHTLKAVNAEKEAENKKLKESNDLKTKRINILEA